MCIQPGFNRRQLRCRYKLLRIFASYELYNDLPEVMHHRYHEHIHFDLYTLTLIQSTLQSDPY
jgi:hypothetical protein